MAKGVGAKSGLSTVNKILFIIFCILLVGTIVFVIVSPAKVAEKAEGEGEGGSSTEDVAVIDEFTPGTYGGIEFKTVDDVVNYYVEVFNYNKTLTAPYKENGEAKNYYKLLGDEKLEIASLLVDGKENATINKLVPGIMNGLFSGSPKGLSPSDNRDPQYDTRDDGAIDEKQSHLTADDVLACNVKDNGDGTITITIQPKGAELSFADKDSQGRFFNVLGDITGTVSQISVLSFSQGDANDNIKVLYQGGTGEITVDTKTKEVTKAFYMMKVHLDITHANVTIIKDKSATMDLEYSNTFPASDEFLSSSKGITRG